MNGTEVMSTAVAPAGCTRTRAKHDMGSKGSEGSSSSRGSDKAESGG
jgi:hypothetical protein